MRGDCRKRQIVTLCMSVSFALEIVFLLFARWKNSTALLVSVRIAALGMLNLDLLYAIMLRIFIFSFFYMVASSSVKFRYRYVDQRLVWNKKLYQICGAMTILFSLLCLSSQRMQFVLYTYVCVDGKY